jgi:hypothetical protein
LFIIQPLAVPHPAAAADSPQASAAKTCRRVVCVDAGIRNGSWEQRHGGNGRRSALEQSRRVVMIREKRNNSFRPRAAASCLEPIAAVHR